MMATLRKWRATTAGRQWWLGEWRAATQSKWRGGNVAIGGVGKRRESRKKKIGGS
jgi:hypothetical protein